MSSAVQICNVGLSSYLGVRAITNLSENTPAALECNLHFDPTVRALLEVHEWNFAKGRQLLAELTNDRSDEWAFKYQRPADALMIRWVNDAAAAREAQARGDSPAAEYELTGSTIYSDVPLATCSFIKFVSDTSAFPQYFSDAVSAAIAARVAFPLTQDFKRANNARNNAERQLDIAMALDERNSPPEEYRHVPDSLKARGVS